MLSILPLVVQPPVSLPPLCAYVPVPRPLAGNVPLPYVELPQPVGVPLLPFSSVPVLLEVSVPLLVS